MVTVFSFISDFLCFLPFRSNTRGIKDAVYDKRYSEAIVSLKESKEKEIYKEKDSILWNLEMGMLKHYNGAYEGE